LIIYQSAINPTAGSKVFELKHLSFPLSSHEKQFLLNLTVTKKDFDKLITQYMIVLDEDLFLKEGYIHSDSFSKFAKQVQNQYPLLDN